MKEVTDQEIPLHPRVMLLFDFEKTCRYKDLTANMLTASTLLLAQRWKTAIVPTSREWLSKVCQLCLLNKLSAVCNYIMGWLNALKIFELQWNVF